MSLTNSQHDTIMRIYDDIRTSNHHIQDERYNEVVALCPEFAQIENQVISISMEAAINRISRTSSDPNTDDYTQRLKQLQNKKQELLSSIGKSADYLDEIYQCPICHDTGYVNQHKCACFTRKAIDLVYRDSNLKNITSDENFNTFSYDWYDNSDDQKDSVSGLTPYKNMQNVLTICQEFVHNFDSEFSNLLFYGSTGVGKTFLTNCIAKALMDSSHSVIYLTATEFFQAFEQQDFNKKKTKDSYDTNYILECDLLIIDDLSTESSNGYTNSKLFYCINERLLRHKSVIISTNLKPVEFRDAYSERVMSRISSAYKILRLFGKDIRMLKRAKASSRH